MRLPQNAIGPTDLIAYRECPRRFSYGMRRHEGTPTPEAGSWATAYGSAAHLLIHDLDEGFDPDAALQRTWNHWGRWLYPEDLDTLRSDGETYLARDFPDTRTILNEQEIRVPLMVYRGEQFFFRTRIDRLLERVDQPGVFIHIDYKTERRPRSREEVRDNLQLWMTNWAVHEFFPECDELVQVYDQLRFGQQETRKTRAARERIHEWIVRSAIAVIEDEEVSDDGLLQPAKNEWCAWCPILESCPIVAHLTSWAKTEIASLAPGEEAGDDELERYAERFADAKQAQKILERFAESVRHLLSELPAERRAELGYELRGRKQRTFSAAALATLHETVGDRFYDLVSVTKTALQSGLADEPEALSFALGLAEDAAGAEVLVAVP